ncbi:uncharacterized protein PSFLO_05257 [Pseudozyma flocculosa]|uniref:Protein kinase domain-containing protein n=1 Tax=Pseudozyma flocculosa TaxID=84751 RepID=A0A5C3F6U8_9BASI|nr:uncharacterized protein PSFLO_05257 [Pseudozyma flocculosa]
MSAGSIDGKLTETTHKAATATHDRDCHDALFAAVAGSLLSASTARAARQLQADQGENVQERSAKVAATDEGGSRAMSWLPRPADKHKPVAATAAAAEAAAAAATGHVHGCNSAPSSGARRITARRTAQATGGDASPDRLAAAATAAGAAGADAGAGAGADPAIGSPTPSAKWAAEAASLPTQSLIVGRGGSPVTKAVHSLHRRKPVPPFHDAGANPCHQRAHHLPRHGAPSQQQGASSTTTTDARAQPLPRRNALDLDHHVEVHAVGLVRDAPPPHRHWQHQQRQQQRYSPPNASHRGLPAGRADILLSPQNAPAGKEQLLMRLAHGHHDRHKDRAQPAVAMGGDLVQHGVGSESSSNSSRRQVQRRNRGNDKAAVFSLSDSQLAARYNFVKEIGFGEWGSIWEATPVKELEHLPASAYPQIATRKLNGVGHVRVDNPAHRPLAIKVCTRERNSQSSARTERLWHEFKMLRSLIDASYHSEGDATCSSSLSSSSSPRGRSRGDRIFGPDWHPSIVKFYEFVVTPSIAMIVMPCYDEPMKVGLPDERCRSYFQQLLSGLFWLHQRGVCHNDIKVANMLVNYTGLLGKGTPILVDFGFATIHDASKKDAFMTHVSWGTPEYLAPERARGDLHDERASDIWSLGVTFFEIAATRTPFELQDEQFQTREQLQAYYHRTMSGVWVGSWDIPPDLEDLVRCMLSAAPADRIDAADALLHPYFDPTSTSFDNSLEDIMDMFPSEDGMSEDEGYSPGETRGAVGHGSRRLCRHESDDDDDGDYVPYTGPYDVPPERLQSRQAHGPHFQQHGRDMMKEGDVNLQIARRPASPPSPTLSAVGMDSLATDLVQASPPWQARPTALRSRPQPQACSKLRMEQAVDSPDGSRDRQVAGASAAEVQRHASDEGTTLSQSPFTKADSAIPLLGRTASLAKPHRPHRTPLKQAIANAAAGSGLLRLVPVASARAPSPMKRDTPSALSPSRPLRTPSRKLQHAPSQQVDTSATATDDFFYPGAAGTTKSATAVGRRLQAPSASQLPKQAAIVTPRTGIRKVASLAKQFGGKVAPSEQPSTSEAKTPKKPGRPSREPSGSRRGHRRSISDSKAELMEERTSARRPSIGVQVDAVRTPDVSEKRRVASGGQRDKASPATPASELTCGSVSVDSYLSSECSHAGAGASSVAEPSLVQTEHHVKISSSFGIVSRPAEVSQDAPAIPPVPATESKMQGRPRPRSGLHRRTKTDLDGHEVRQKLEQMGAIAEALARMISETRSSLLGSWAGSELDRAPEAGERDTLLQTIQELEIKMARLEAARQTSTAASEAAAPSKPGPLSVSGYGSSDAPLSAPCHPGQCSQRCSAVCRQSRVRAGSEATVTPARRVVTRSADLVKAEINVIEASPERDASPAAGAQTEAQIKSESAAAPRPPPPSRDQIEAMYASHLLRRDSKQNHSHDDGDGGGSACSSPERARRQPQSSPHDNALSPLLEPPRTPETPSSPLQSSPKLSGPDHTPSELETGRLPEKRSSVKRFGLATLRRPKSLASLFPGRAASGPTAIGMRRESVAPELPSPPNEMGDVKVVSPHTFPRATLSKTPIATAMTTMPTPRSEGSSYISPDLSPIVESEVPSHAADATSGVTDLHCKRDGTHTSGSGSGSDGDDGSDLKTTLRHGGVQVLSKTTTTTTTSAGANAPPTDPSRLGVAPGARRRSSSLHRLSREHVRPRTLASSGPVVAAAKKAQRTSTLSTFQGGTRDRRAVAHVSRCGCRFRFRYGYGFG